MLRWPFPIFSLSPNSLLFIHPHSVGPSLGKSVNLLVEMLPLQQLHPVIINGLNKPLTARDLPNHFSSQWCRIGVMASNQTTCLFVKQLFGLATKKISKLHITDSLWGEATGNWCSLHKGPVMQKGFPCHQNGESFLGAADNQLDCVIEPYPYICDYL